MLLASVSFLCCNSSFTVVMVKLSYFLSFCCRISQTYAYTGSTEGDLMNSGLFFPLHCHQIHVNCKQKHIKPLNLLFGFHKLIVVFLLSCGPDRICRVVLTWIPNINCGATDGFTDFFYSSKKYKICHLKKLFITIILLVCT